jgi:hypothetical protein
MLWFNKLSFLEKTGVVIAIWFGLVAGLNGIGAFTTWFKCQRDSYGPSVCKVAKDLYALDLKMYEIDGREFPTKDPNIDICC